MAFSASSSGETDDAFTITWDDSPEDTTDIQISGGGFATQIVTESTASVTISGLTPETAYSVTVSALSSIGAVLDSDSVTATTLEESSTTPTTPVDFAVTCSAATSESVTLSWVGEPATTAQINFAVAGVGNENAGRGTSPVVYDGLTADTSYTITAEARTTDGTVLDTDSLVCATTEDFTITATVTESMVTIAWPAITGATSYTYTVYLGSTVVTTTSTASNVVGVGIGGTDSDYTVTVQALSGTTVLLEEEGAFTTWAAESETLSLTTPVLTRGTWVADPTSLELTAPSATSSTIAVRLADPDVATITEYRVFLTTYDSLPSSPTPADPVESATPDPVPVELGLYFGSFMPSAYPVTLNLTGLASATFYSVLVNGLNAAGEIVAFDTVGKTTT